MPRTLSNSQKASFLRRRISDTETVAAKEITFVEKNYPLFEKKVTLLNQMRRESKQHSDAFHHLRQRERERFQDKSGILENALRLLNRLANGLRLIRAISNLRKSTNQQATNAELAALASELGLARNTRTKPKQKSKPARNSSATQQSLS